MADKLVFDGWLKVYNRIINNKTYDILKDHDAVAAVITDEFNDILLVKQFRPALMEETLEIPAGTIDKDDEDPASCMIRELKEEAQLTLKQDDLKYVLSYKPNVGFSNSKMIIFYSKILKDDIKEKIINDEDVYEVLWMNFDEFKQKINYGEIIDVKTLIAYFILKTYYKL